MSDLTLMTVFAHPDDEAFGTGGTLSKYAAEGCDVYLVTATRGEAGEIAEPDLATSADLPFVREQELRCACETYGIHSPRFLDYADGLLSIIHQGQAVGKVVRLIRELRPQVIITFGPEGIYGHYDHIAVHRWTSIAVDLASQADCFPHHIDGACEPHQVSKLYFRVMPQEQIEARRGTNKTTAMVMDGVPFRFVGRPLEEITAIIDVTEYVEQKLCGIQCHATQVGRQKRFAAARQEVLRDPWFRSEHFLLAHSAVGRSDGVETDLFAGLR
ncbi:MAG: PIG-L deacetylase family protein [Anaerolineae bacterium]